MGNLQKGDPMVRVQLPEVLVSMLEGSAKKNKRRVQDQFIKVLAETFRNETAFDGVAQKFIPDLKTVYQNQ
jgi:hypothetical protein